MDEFYQRNLQSDQFYITLNSAINDNEIVLQQPTANAASFTTHLPQTIRLSAGNWKEAIHQLYFHPSFQMFLVNDAEAPVLLINYNNQVLRVTFPQNKSFTNLSDMLDYLNTILLSPHVGDMVNFNVRWYDSKLKVRIDVGKGCRVHLSSYLAFIFGFTNKPHTPMEPYYLGSLDSDTEDYTFFVSPKTPMNFFTREIVQIHCDICANEIGTTKHLPLLLTFRLKKTVGDNDMIGYTFENPRYVPVMGNYISSIGLKFVDIYGYVHRLSDERYPTVVDLHFKRF